MDAIRHSNSNETHASLFLASKRPGRFLLKRPNSLSGCRDLGAETLLRNRVVRQRQQHREFAAVPRPALRATTEPPCSSTVVLTRRRPIGSPSFSGGHVPFNCVNASRIFDSSFSSIPEPLSHTRTTAMPSSGSTVMHRLPLWPVTPNACSGVCHVTATEQPLVRTFHQRKDAAYSSESVPSSSK